MVMTQAQAVSNVDVYWLLGATAALMFNFWFPLAKNESGAGGEVPKH